MRLCHNASALFPLLPWADQKDHTRICRQVVLGYSRGVLLRCQCKNAFWNSYTRLGCGAGVLCFQGGDEIERPGQAPRVGSENTFGTALHGDSFRRNLVVTRHHGW